MPGVYMQGLLIYNPDGSIMHEESLAEHLCHEVIALAKELGKTEAAQMLILILTHSTDIHLDPTSKGTVVKQEHIMPVLLCDLNLSLE